MKIPVQVRNLKDQSHSSCNFSVKLTKIVCYLGGMHSFEDVFGIVYYTS